jgi:hypothetical protein
MTAPGASALPAPVKSTNLPAIKSQLRNAETESLRAFLADLEDRLLNLETQ